MTADTAARDAIRSARHGESRESRQKAPLSCISDITGRLMERGYLALGLAIGNRPKLCLTCGLLIYLLFLPGLVILKGDKRMGLMNLSTDFFEQFTWTDSQYYRDYMRATALFPEVRKNVLLLTSNKESVVSVEFLRAAVKVEREVLAQVAGYEGRVYSFEDLCDRADAGKPCRRNSLVSMLLPDPAVLDGLAGAAPAAVAEALLGALHPFLRLKLEMLVGASVVPFPGTGANVTQLSEWLAGAKSCAFEIRLRPGAPSEQFELKVQRILEDFHGREEEGPLRLTGLLGVTVDTEAPKVLTSVSGLQGLATLVMMVYAVTFLATQTRLPGQSQILVVALSVQMPMLASLAGMGCLGYAGLRLNMLSLSAPFLVLAQGVDALFVLVSALKSMGPELDTPTAISRAVAKGGAAITITAFTSICAFGVAWLSTPNFVGIADLNFLLAVSIALSNFGMLIIVPSLLTLGELRMKKGRMDLLPCRPQPEAEGPVARTLRRADPGPVLRKFVTHTYAPLPERSRAFVAAGILIFTLLMGIGALGFRRIGSGMPDSHYFKDTSYIQAFMAEVESQYGGAMNIEMGLLLEQPRLGDPAYGQGLSAFLGELDARPDVLLVDCSALYAPNARLADGTGRCVAMVRQQLDPSARVEQTEELMALVARAGVPALLYDKSFATSVYGMETIRPAILQTVLWALIAVFGALLLTMPAHMALVATANVCCILLSLFGFMGFTGLTFSANTFVGCLMAVGFCVDYTCHVIHAAAHHAKADEPWPSRVRRSLETCGYDVLHGCITAMVGVALLGFGGSVAFRTVTKFVLLITSLGGIYALVTLPALLSVATLLSGPVRRGEKGTIDPANPGTGSPQNSSSDSQASEGPQQV